MREFDQARKLRQRILGARLLCARGAQPPLEFVEIDLVRRTGPGNTHIILTRRGHFLARVEYAATTMSASASPRGR